MEDSAVPAKSQSLNETLQRHESLLGRPFRRVDQGLDPDDIVEYLEMVGGSSEAAFERLEQFSAVQAAAGRLTDWIAQAKQMAEDARAQTEAEARAEAARMVDEAARQAEEIRGQAEAQALSDVARIMDEADQMARQLAAEIKEKTQSEARSQAALLVEEAGEKALSMLEETAVDCLKPMVETKWTLVSLIDEVLERSKTSVAGRIQDTLERVQRAKEDHQAEEASCAQVSSSEVDESPGTNDGES
jgi:F0F1-type ATP synthase membrane subunit b/b'